MSVTKHLQPILSVKSFQNHKSLTNAQITIDGRLNECNCDDDNDDDDDDDNDRMQMKRDEKETTKFE